MKTGMPIWTSNGWQYNRGLMGIGPFLIIITIVISATQYIIQFVQYFEAKYELKEIRNRQQQMTPKELKLAKKRGGDKYSVVLMSRAIRNVNPPETWGPYDLSTFDENVVTIPFPSITNLYIFKLPGVFVSLFSQKTKNSKKKDE
jgi:hypothetical protein